MQAKLALNYVAGAAVAKRRIVKFSADKTVIHGAAATDASIGVTADLDAAQGERVDVYRQGVVEIDAGGAIGRGDPITSDAAGKAVAANPAAGTRSRIIGFAEVSAVNGDIVDVLLAPGFITTPA